MKQAARSANNMPILRALPTICSGQAPCLAIVLFCVSAICHQKRLYVFNPATTPKDLRGLVGGKIREELIVANWPDLFRCAATMAAGKIKPRQLLRKFASYPRQNDLAAALREIGRVERTLFIIEWILDTDMQRRAQIGLN